MSIDPTLFKQVMAQWSSGITVITSTADGSWQGITANSFTSVSVSPPLVSVNIDRKLYIHSIISKSGVFAANILSAEQVEWGKLFAGFFPEIQDRFEGMSCQVATTGSPILPNVMGWVDCEVRHAFDVGDHTIFVGEAVAGSTPASSPALAYHNRSWGEFVTQLPDKVQIVEVSPADVGIIESLLDAGITRIQVDTTPTGQLANLADIHHNLPKREGVIYSTVALDVSALERALTAGFTHIDLLVPAHNEYSRDVFYLPLPDAMEQFVMMVSRAHESGLSVSSRILGAFGNRDEMQAVVDLVQNCLDGGVQEIVLDDSTGVANPLTIRKNLTIIMAAVGKTPISLRLSNRQGFGLANMLAALQTGVIQFETAVDRSDTSLVPTEDAANLLHSMGIQTGINTDVFRRVESTLPGDSYFRSNTTEKAVE